MWCRAAAGVQRTAALIIISSTLLLHCLPQHLSSEINFVFVIRGGQVYREAVNSPLCDAVHLTEIKSSFNCDTFMAAVDVNLFQ